MLLFTYILFDQYTRLETMTSHLGLCYGRNNTIQISHFFFSFFFFFDNNIVERYKIKITNKPNTYFCKKIYTNSIIASSLINIQHIGPQCVTPRNGMQIHFRPSLKRRQKHAETSTPLMTFL